MIKKHDKSALIKIHNCLAPINKLTVEGSSETALSREWFNQVFYSL